jgi:hypothetical protein
MEMTATREVKRVAKLLISATPIDFISAKDFSGTKILLPG